MKIPPWFPLASMVTGAFVLVIIVWITVFKLAKEVDIQPYEENSASQIQDSP